MKIAVFGSGGVGGYFGGRLARGGADVHLIARGRHLEALRADGLRVRSIRGDFDVRLPATDDPHEVGACDFVLFTVKSFDTASAAEKLGPLVGPDTGVVSLQNGIDNEDLIAEIIGRQHVMGGVAYIFSTISEPGVISDVGGPAKLVFGELDGTRSARAEEFLSACTAAGIDAEISEDVRAAEWFKFALICALAGMTASVRLPVGDIRSTPESWDMFRRILDEVHAVATAAGINLPADTVARHMEFAQTLEPHGYSSLHFDMTHGKPMELGALHGTVVQLGRKHGVATPMNEAVLAVLSPWARRHASPD